MIYFIQAGEDGPVKIGRAKDPVARLAGLQTGSSESLHIRAVLDEPDHVETRLHDVLKSARLKGEWFSTGVLTLCVMACAMAGFAYGPAAVVVQADGVCPECERFRLQTLDRMRRYRARKRDGFDRTAYQREYMREYRKRKKS